MFHFTKSKHEKNVCFIFKINAKYTITLKLISRKYTENAMAKKINKKTNRQTTVHQSQQKKIKTEQQEPNQKLGVISGAPEGLKLFC